MGVPAFFRWLCTRSPGIAEGRASARQRRERLPENGNPLTTAPNCTTLKQSETHQLCGILRGSFVGSGFDLRVLCLGRYPKIVKDIIEKPLSEVEGRNVPEDWDEGNPNGVDFDNLSACSF